METRWVWVVAVAAVVGLYVWYAVIVARRNKVREALGSIDVHLAQRHDLIPNIVKLAGRFMEHERGLLADVARLRSEARQPIRGGDAGEVGRRFAAEQELGQRVGQLLVTMEAYPELKSDATVLEAQRTWTEIEGQVTAARRFYNAAVNRLNNAVQVFPGTLLAAAAGVSAMPYFEAPAAAHVAPDVDAILPRGGRP